MSIFSATTEWPSHLIDLKRELVNTEGAQERLTKSWNEIICELAARTGEVVQEGPNYIPQVDFMDLEKLTMEEINEIKRKGCIVIRGVVDPKIAAGWKTELDEFIQANPHIKGFPPEGVQMFDTYWTRPQVQARAHPNILKATAWLSSLYHVQSGKNIEGVDLSVPLAYADRFRIRKPTGIPGILPPHVDGGAMERWEDANFRECFEEILAGNWRQHDPYEFERRLKSRAALCGKPGQVSVFRSFQGWFSISGTGPKQGTLKVFPDVLLANAYLILRPFFRPTVPEDSPDIFDPKNWKFDISTGEFPGILLYPGGSFGPQPTRQSHPHLRIDETMTSIPKVSPGDMVFWHCDLIHSVEHEHTGSNDSAVMYIAAVPKTPENSAYIAKQREAFLQGVPPPDYVADGPEITFTGLATEAEVKEPIARVAMGLPISMA